MSGLDAITIFPQNYFRETSLRSGVQSQKPDYKNLFSLSCFPLVVEVNEGVVKFDMHYNVPPELTKLYEWIQKPEEFDQIRIFENKGGATLNLIDSNLYPDSIMISDGFYSCTCICVKAVDHDGNVYWGLNHIFHKPGKVNPGDTLDRELKELHEQLKEKFADVQFIVNYNPKSYLDVNETELAQKYNVIDFHARSSCNQGEGVCMDQNEVKIYGKHGDGDNTSIKELKTIKWN